jgi:hypothetical protein
VPLAWHTALRRSPRFVPRVRGMCGALLCTMNTRRAVRHSLSIFAVLAATLATACSFSADKLGEGATPVNDGANGVCCRPSTGGCANIGGYREDSDCSQGSLCDNMCEQEIVDDVHGCKKMVYKSPPVTTTYAGTGSCSDPVYNGHNPYDDRDGGKDSGDANAKDANAKDANAKDAVADVTMVTDASGD